MAQSFPLLDLMQTASALKQARNYLALVTLLESVPDELLFQQPELGYYLALAWLHTGNTDYALSLVQKLEQPLSREGSDKYSRYRTNLEGSIYFSSGRIEEAEQIWEVLYSTSAVAHDEQLLAWIGTHLGIIADLRGDHTKAIAHYSRAILACSRLGDRLGLMSAHNNLAITYRQLRHFDKAESHFLLALAYARDIAAEPEIGLCEVERSLLHCETGDIELAEASAMNALRRFQTIGDPGGEGEALRALGIIASRIGRTEVATAHFEGALCRARKTERKLLEAEVQEELYFINRQSGLYEKATRAIEDALRLLQEMGAIGRVNRLVRRMTGVAAPEPLAAGPREPRATAPFERSEWMSGP